MRFALLHRSNTSYITPLLIVGVLVVLNGVALLLYTNIYILSYRTYIVDNPAELLGVETALVFGGGMNADGTQSLMQMDRVATAIALYESGVVSEIRMTGDDGASRYDEVSAMKAQAVQYWATDTDVYTDPHGYRTYESCWRAAHVYDMDTVIVVSQSFHLPRIIYLCRSMGIEAYGISANLREYEGSLWAIGPREMLARLKAWWQVTVTRPKPAVAY